jgi:hypothetical protein
MQNTCQSCSNVFMSDSSATGYRCGENYFKQPPAERKMSRMETYQQVEVNHCCDLYQQQEKK